VPRLNIDRTSKIMGVLSDYWLLIIGALIAIPLLYKYYMNFVSTSAENAVVNSEKDMQTANQSPVTQSQGLNKITTRLEVQQIAKNVAHHFGTDILTKEASSDWFGLGVLLHPTSWSENDQEALIELLKVKQPLTVPLVISCYYFITRRDLKNDIKSYLPDSYIKQLPLFN